MDGDCLVKWLSRLDIANIEEATMRVSNATDKSGGGARKPVFHLEGLFGGEGGGVWSSVAPPVEAVESV